MGNLPARESKGETVGLFLKRVETPRLAPDELAERIGELRRAVEQRDTAAALAAARRMAPEYEPSAELHKSLNAGVGA